MASDQPDILARENGGRRSTNGRPSLSVHTMLAFVLTSAVLFVNEANLRTTDAFDASADWQTLLKIVICLACGLYGVIYGRFADLVESGLAPLFGVALVGWAGLCIVQAVNATYSLSCCLTLGCMLVFAPAALYRLGPRGLVLTTLVTTILFAVGCWVVRVIAPEMNAFDPFSSSAADARRLAGLVHPNGTAGQSAVIIAMAIVAARHGYAPRPLLYAAVAFALLTIIATGSRTWLLGALVLLAYAGWIALGPSSRLTLSGAALCLAGLGAFYFIATLNPQQVDSQLASVSRSGESREIYSATGRADLWVFCLEKIASSPLTGYGYGCQRFVIADEHYWQTRHAHNIVLNITLGTGIVGGLLLTAALLFQLWNLCFAPTPFPDVVLLMALTGGMTENPLFNPIPATLTMLFFVSLFWRGISQHHSS